MLTLPQKFHLYLSSKNKYKVQNLKVSKVLCASEEAGIYKLCWCKESVERNCSLLQHFNVVAGGFIYAGPYTLSPKEVVLSERLVVDAAGIGLTGKDQTMLLKSCGSGPMHGDLD